MAEPRPALPSAPVADLKQRLAARLQASWLEKGWLSFALLDVSLVYRCLVAIRRWGYERGCLASWKAPVPVIVIGNVAAGGAGKTPIVIEVARDLLRRGYTPGVVSRGYGRSVSKADYEVFEVFATTPASRSGDEPALIRLAQAAPVFVANERSQAIRALLKAYPQTDVIVCDDGLQHLALQRDIEVCVFDERRLGNGRLLPAGPLREPWPRRPYGSGASEAPLQVLLYNVSAPLSGDAPTTRFTEFAGFTAFTTQRRLADHALSSDGSRLPLDTLRERQPSQPIAALAAIAQPEAFFSMLRAAGLQLDTTIALPDHYNFNSWLRNIYKDYSLICTEKDAVKLWQHEPDALAVPLMVSVDPAFFTALHDKLSSSAEKQ